LLKKRTFLTQLEGQVVLLHEASQMYGIFTAQSECARTLLLSVPAGSNTRQRSAKEVVALVKLTRNAVGTAWSRAHHEKLFVCTSHLSFTPDVQYFSARWSDRGGFYG
jgi:hypothetical protein